MDRTIKLVTKQSIHITQHELDTILETPQPRKAGNNLVPYPFNQEKEKQNWILHQFPPFSLLVAVTVYNLQLLFAGSECVRVR